jgi:hypothetical protein
VGTLGLPTVPLLQKLGLPTTIHSYRFTDTGISKRVLNAFQALALDERRSTFQATLWEKKPDNTITNLKQVWFPGVHCNVGGGYADTSIADLTLAWMIDHLSPMIEFNTKYLPTQVQANIALNYLPPPTAASSATTSKATAASKSLKPWRYGLGTVYDSDTFPYSLAGSSQRTPGTYHELNYTTGKPTKVMLRQTNEFVHASVRARIKFGGTDANGKQYDPEGLEDWELVQGTEAMGSPSGTGTGALWMYRGSDAGAKGRVLEEDTLGKTELMVLDLDPEMKQNLFG